MHVLAINGSPRKNWYTATLLEQALAGAAETGAETELVHLYDLNFKGCTSCFACKRSGGKSEGRCAYKDEATPVLERIRSTVDLLILGSPIYFGAMSGEMRSFLERLLFAPFVYTQPISSLFPRRIKTACIYTMNLDEADSKALGYEQMFQSTASFLTTIFGFSETLCCYDTCQFPDYSKVVMEYMDAAAKLARKEQIFPEDCRKAFALGRRLAG